MGSDSELAFENAKVPEPVYPGDQDIVHGRHLYRNEGKDIDLYRFELTEGGVLTAETMAERQLDSSLLDSVISLYRERAGQQELIARNDDYFSEDSYLQLDLEPGVYYVGVSAAGNLAYDPQIEDSGFGGVSEGKYDLRLTFQPNADRSLVDRDNSQTTGADPVSRATALDGDGDGEPGGVFNFWFRVATRTLYVDAYGATGCTGTGSLTNPGRLAPGNPPRRDGHGGQRGGDQTAAGIHRGGKPSAHREPQPGRPPGAGQAGAGR